MTDLLAHYRNPEASAIGNNVHEFMVFLGGPASIFLSGEDQSRTRAFVTLLHGNEPSGALALFRWIKSQRKPAVNILCILGSIEAAQSEPAFNQRVVPPKRDLNRCFRAPFDDEQGILAKAIIDTLSEHQPEAVIDMHNTSGSGPSFAVATHMDDNHEALTTLFTQRLVVTHLRLGALMEISEHLFPTVTIECGGRQDDEAHQTAWDGINNYFSANDVLRTGDTDWGLEVLHNPVRLELKADVSLCYEEKARPDYDLILPPSIEHLNSGVTAADTFLGWVNVATLGELFRSTNSQQQCVLDELIYIHEGKLHSRQALKLFMITGSAEIAKMDCLFYAVKSDGQEIVAGPTNNKL